MTKGYTFSGLVITIIYTIGFMYFLSDRLEDLARMKLNEIGDFLAGIFGPVALLWLILGYFQQGIELKQNTRALELQADELKNSVEQQRELVEVSRQQFQAQFESLQFERTRFEESYLPRFVLGGFGGRHKDAFSWFTVPITNLGAVVSDVLIESNVPLMGLDPKRMSHWKKDGRLELKFAIEQMMIATNFELHLSYVDAAGRSGKCFFKVDVDLSRDLPVLSSSSTVCQRVDLETTT